jgi:RecJ-like exonuclease
MAFTLMKINKDFQISVIKMLKEDFIEEIKKRKPDLVIFTDIGSGYLDLINNIGCDVIITDHHEIEGKPSDNIIHINPEVFDVHLSGAGTTYLLAREILKNDELAPLAVVGTVGDTIYSTNSKLFETPLIEIELGLNLFGRYSRPLYKALELSKIPGVSGNPSKAIQFLSEVGITLQKDGRWRTLADLTEEETRKLTDAIVKECLKHGDFEKEKIFGNILTLKNYPDELKDAKEFATLLNSCANMNEPAIGIAVCLGSRKALTIAKGLLKGYRRLISNYLRWIENHPENVRRTEYANYIIAGDNINENLIGTIVSMLFKPSEKTLIGLANGEEGVKVSARSKDVNIREVIAEAARRCGGRGGGHKSAAGATIPFGKEEEFIEVCERILKKLHS